MSTPLVTEQSVAGAADELKKEGKTVSYRAIRERTGGGSPRSILTRLHNWLENDDAEASATIGATMLFRQRSDDSLGSSKEKP
jgi:hypothetical protein